MTHDEPQNNSSNTGTKVPMTHDELLAKVDEQIAIWSSGEYGWPRQWLSDEVKSKTPMASYFKALRAVVELHKPVAFGNAYWCANDCHAETKLTRKQRAKGMTEWLAPVRYPCPTIQAIEKELR